MIIGIVAASGTIIAAIIRSAIGNVGWRSSIKKDIELFYKLYPLVDSGQEEVDLEVFRRRIFKKLNKSMMPMSRNLKIFLYYFVCGYLLSFPVSALLGFSINQETTINNLISSFLIALLIAVGHKILEHWPKCNINPIFKQKESMQKFDSLMQKCYHTLEKEHAEEGWISNFALYEQFKRKHWGYVGKGTNNSKDAD